MLVQLADAHFGYPGTDIFTGLTRANFRVDTVLEPDPLPSGPRSMHWSENFRKIPRTLIVRARKEGI